MHSYSLERHTHIPQEYRDHKKCQCFMGEIA